MNGEPAAPLHAGFRSPYTVYRSPRTVYPSGMNPTSKRFPTPVRLALLIALVVPSCARAQREPQALPAVPAFPTGSLSGQVVAVLPLTLVVADPTLQSDSVYAAYRDRRSAVLRADSLVGEGLEGRGPEITWVLPPELRKMARRAAGFVEDPDQMGQAILRATKLTVVPDPLRSSLRSLMAVAGGRIAMVPAALGFGTESDGRIRADLSLVLADSRTGKIFWRSLALGRGKSPDEALNAAIASVLPLTGGP